MGNIYFPFLTSFGETVKALCDQDLNWAFASKTLVYQEGYQEVQKSSWT